MPSLDEIATKMKEEAAAVVAQAKKEYANYAHYIKILTQIKNIAGKNQTPHYVTLEVPYMTVDGRIKMCIDDHSESGEKPKFGTAVFTKSPDGSIILCGISVETKRGKATGTIEVNIGGGGADKTNPYANAETSALGRALGFMGYGSIGTGIASYEEVEGAVGGRNGTNINGSTAANKLVDTTGKSVGTTAGTTGAEGKVTAISAQIKIKAKTALVQAGYTDQESAGKVNGAKTMDDINALIQEAGAKRRAAEVATGDTGKSDNGAKQSDNKSQKSPASEQGTETVDTSKGNGAAPSSEEKASNGGDEGKPISAKEIIGLKKKLKESGKTDDDLAKILPGVKTLRDYRTVIKEYGIAA